MNKPMLLGSFKTIPFLQETVFLGEGEREKEEEERREEGEERDLGALDFG